MPRNDPTFDVTPQRLCDMFPPSASRAVSHVPFLLAVLAILCAPTPVTAGGRPVSFRTDVMAVLSTAGCNQGTCHGNANGKGGFKLSLRGDDPDFDFTALARDLSARRVNPAQPADSLLLLKPTMQLAHEGGRRFEFDSLEYRILRDWIAGGMRDDRDTAPSVTSLQVTPQELIVNGIDEPVPLRVEATFSDGSTRDVTSLAVFEPSEPIVDINRDGIVSAERYGEVTIAVRYLNQRFPVRLAYIPDRPDYVWEGPDERNEVDRLVFARLKSLKITPSPVCDDTVFVRRAYLDLLGHPPTGEEARRFVEDPSPSKRAALVEELLQRPGFAEFQAIRWADLLRIEEKTLDRKGVENFHGWVRQQMARNRPMDEFARELIAARGSTYASPPANYYRAMRDPLMRAESTAQVFLGLRLQCAKCHNHPFDRWTQDDYYGWASVFAGVDYKILENRRRDRNDKHEFVGEQIVWIDPARRVKDPRTGKDAPARFLDEAPLADGEDPLLALADWVTRPDNPYFARLMVNRVWHQLFGRGLVQPIDDFRMTNPPVHPELLDWLAEDFVANGYDLRHTIRTIMNSAVYQLSSEPNDTNAGDETHASRAVVRRLDAEQLLDAIAQAIGAPVEFNGYPPGTRATQIAGVHAIRPRYKRPTPGDEFLMLFGKPPRLQSCDCERSNEPTLAQTFELISGPMVDRLLTRPDNTLGRWLSDGRGNEEIVRDLYWTVLSRPPSKMEEDAALGYLQQSDNRRAACEDLLWSLLNAAEFSLRR
ncbi:DUF1549 and DUF1553 domain-containing protein [Maioricimonas sp. JC845]|uniref:DUF1549 and DUF1553 domain-containing protein n=1 Tax=Maioricimonas sp. JC845 TaxID=3232138 RepID=UPI003459C63B